MDKIKIGIIGMGSMARNHYAKLKTIPAFEVTALADVNPAALQNYPEKKFLNGRELIEKGGVGAVLIATPHFDHVPLAVAALKKKIHVLVEKPVAVHGLDAQKMVKAHTDKAVVFAAMFNQRTRPAFCKVKELVERGELGKLQRVSWIITDWYRTDAYYRSSPWRATWKGEGGGVLLNQCPHNLDILQWICGMPDRVTAVIGIGKHHAIEVEDEVSAILEFPGGMTGTFVTSTGEAPGSNRFEVAGSRGKLVLEDNNRLRFVRNEVPSDEFCRTSKEIWSAPNTWEVGFPQMAAGDGEQHAGIMKNFRDAILKGAPLIAPAEEGLNSLALGNAMLMSGVLKKPVKLPLDDGRYVKTLKKLETDASKRKKK
ncbi:MAG: Gfo/Idh/MocA family oxidoreductase [Fibrobacterota bacterium]